MVDVDPGEAVTVGSRIARAREARGLEREEIARHLAVTVRTVQRWEEGRSEPGAGRLRALSEVLGVSVPWLLAGAGAGPVHIVKIRGDVVATEEVSISTRGGSLGATLRKGIRDRVALGGRQLAGGVVEFSAGQSLVLLSGASTRPGVGAFQVRRISANRYEVELETQDMQEEEVDAMTAAFLALKSAQFERGELRLTPPVTADEWRAGLDGAFAATEPPDA